MHIVQGNIYMEYSGIVHDQTIELLLQDVVMYSVLVMCGVKFPPLNCYSMLITVITMHAFHNVLVQCGCLRSLSVLKVNGDFPWYSP